MTLFGFESLSTIIQSRAETVPRVLETSSCHVEVAEGADKTSQEPMPTTALLPVISVPLATSSNDCSAGDAEHSKEHIGKNVYAYLLQ